MRNPGGCITWYEPGSVERACDTYTCVHCNRVVVVESKTTGGYCLRCMRPICDRPACHGRCVPFERRLEAYERRERLRAALTAE